MSEPQTDTAPDDDSRVTNTATGDAKVEAQIGYVEGDAVFHKHETIYQVADGDSAERKYQVARNLIDGGIPRLAENLLGEALSAGLMTTEVAYYYAISILSERSLNQLGPQELDKLDRAMRVAAKHPEDEWHEAIVVIGNLVRCVLHPDAAADPRSSQLHVVLESFRVLPDQRRAEITRHLDMIFSGAVQEQLDRVGADTIAAERVKGDRADRAWKYFHSDPTPPRRSTPAPLRNGQPRSGAWVAAVLGAAGFCTAVVIGAEPLDTVGLPLAPLSLFVVGALVAGRYGARVFAMNIRRQLRELEQSRFLRALEDPEDPYLNFNRPLKFVRTARKRVNYYFGVRMPDTDKDKWNARTIGVKAALHARLVRLYGTGRIEVSTVNWLIRWHAKRAAEQWRAGTLPDLRRTLQPSPVAVLAVWGGAGLLCCATAWLIDDSSGFAPTATAILQIVTGCVGILGITYLLGDHQAMASERTELDELFDEEEQEFVRWRERLSDRPTDSEMANWLEYDKAHLKTLAIERCGLNNRDIIAHVVLTAGNRDAKRARVKHGPPRFSKYIVLVFLLTENGVREVDVDLNFLTTAIYDERRTAFRYDALASAKVLEEGFKSAEGRWHLVRLGPDVHVTDKSALVISRTFRLSLVNDQTIEVVMDNYEGLLDDAATEDRSHLADLALDSSGVAVALQILESVAAEGREWIAREQDRRTRRWDEWERGRNGRAELTGRPVPLSIGPSRATSDEDTSRSLE
jgi:hypothetical protein